MSRRPSRRRSRAVGWGLGVGAGVDPRRRALERGRAGRGVGLGGSLASTDRAGRSPRPQPATQEQRWPARRPSRPAAGRRSEDRVGPCPVDSTSRRQCDAIGQSSRRPTGCRPGSAPGARTRPPGPGPRPRSRSRARPLRLATKQARSAASRTDSAVSAVGRERGHPDRGADQRPAVGPAGVDADRADRVAYPVGHEQRAGADRARQQVGEFVAAVAEDLVGVPPGPHQRIGDRPAGGGRRPGGRGRC